MHKYTFQKDFGPNGRKGIPNLFEEPMRQSSIYTDQEFVSIQSRLEKQLGPEFLSSRTGPNGKKVHYLTAEKCIQVANSVFGFNGWSSQIIDYQVDFIDENPQTLKISLGLSVVVRVTLKDGTFHEDVGYGHVENYKGKALAFEKAKKEGTTDALKRALRNFGNVLGNCIYDKEYLRQVSKVESFSPKWNEENLFRDKIFTLSPELKDVPKVEKENITPIIDAFEQKEDSGSEILRASNEEFSEEDFGDFDEADFSVADPDCHPDEVVLSQLTPSANKTLMNSPKQNLSSDSEITKNNIAIASEINSIQTTPLKNGQQNKKKNIVKVAQPSQTCDQRKDSLGSISGRESVVQNKLNKPISGNSTPTSRILNQPNRTNINNQNSSLISPHVAHNFSSNSSQENETLNSQTLGSGFYSARTVNMFSPLFQNQSPSLVGPPDPVAHKFPLFNPHTESPSIRKTPGIDHKSSKPLTKDLRHISCAIQSPIALAISGSQATGLFSSGSNVIHPSLDNIRRIGAPASPTPTGLSNTKGTGFRIPMKRTTDNATGRTSIGLNRVPLEVLSINTNSSKTEIADLKRQKLHS